MWLLQMGFWQWIGTLISIAIVCNLIDNIFKHLFDAIKHTSDNKLKRKVYKNEFVDVDYK